MRYFINNTLTFLLIFILIICIFIIVSNNLIVNGDYFKLRKKDTKYLVLGHSHPECAFNDSLITGLENYAQSAESFFFTYIKTKKIINSNKQIKAIFISFSNNQIDKKMDDWTWGDDYLSNKFPKYSAFMNLNDLVYLFTKNPKIFLNSQALSLKENILFLSKEKGNYMNYKSWGGFRYLVRDKTDSLIKATKNNPFLKSSIYELTERNINYLTKTIEFCRRKEVKVYLFRCPLHVRYLYLSNENRYKDILKTKFSNVEYLDFKDFPLQNTDFGDFEHLNYKGAIKFSIFFNRLLESNLLERTNKQAFIDNEIEMINKDCFFKYWILR